MSDLMLTGVLRMPIDPADAMGLMQKQDRCNQAADRIEADTELLDTLRAQLQQMTEDRDSWEAEAKQLQGEMAASETMWKQLLDDVMAEIAQYHDISLTKVGTRPAWIKATEARTEALNAEVKAVVNRVPT